MDLEYNMNNVFKFKINKTVEDKQVISITLSAPFFAFNLSVDKDYEKNLRLAKAELKMAIMEALLNGTWEVVE